MININNKNVIYNNKFKLLIFLLLIIISVCWVNKNFLFKNNNLEAGKKFKISQPQNYLQPLVIALGDNILSIVPIDAANAQMKNVDYNTIQYLDAYNNTDVEQIKYPDKLKESLILKGSDHPDKFVYQIDQENFDWQIDAYGDIIISAKNRPAEDLPSSDGTSISAEQMRQYQKERNKIFKIPQPFMIEQGRQERGAVQVEIVGDQLILTPDSEWIKNHHYPIVVDPTVEKMPQMIEELAEKRSYNTLTFLNDDGSYTTMAHVGQINYKDEQNKFRLINTALQKGADGWEQNTASYAAEFPEYADEWLTFTNQYEGSEGSLKIRPLAAHLAGQIVEESEDGWANKKVVYNNAFGIGEDLELIAGRVALFKLIKLNQKPAGLVADREYVFELGLAAGEKLIINDQEWSGQETVWTSQPVGIKSADGRIFYMRKFTVWDSDKNSQSIQVKISSVNGKIYLTKILPQEFLARAVYPVYSDASVSYYTGAVDGSVYTNTATSWATARAAATGDGVSNTRADREYARSEFADPTYEIFRLFLPFDSSALDDSATISAATLNLYGGYFRAFDNDGNDYSVVVQTSQASPSALTTADYDQVGSTAGSATYDTSVLVEGAWNAFPLNATGLSWVSKTGYTLLGIREGHDMANDTPTARITHEYAISESAYDPYLSITYNVTPTVSSVSDTPDPTNPGRSVSFIYDWNDDAGDYIKIKICKTNSLTNQNCDGGYWASSTDFTTADPAVVVYDVVGDDAGQTRDYWAFACDNSGACTTGTSGTFSVNAQSAVPNIKVRGGLRVR